MELVWDDHPIPDGPFFTRDLYDKYTLAPQIRELWASLQSPSQKDNVRQEWDVGHIAASSSMPKKNTADSKDSVFISSQESCLETNNDNDTSSHSDAGAEGKQGRKRNKPSKTKQNQKEAEVMDVYPEPRLPFPCMSSLTDKEQKTYVSFMLRKRSRAPAQNLRARLNNEVTQFMKYLQDAAKLCADDYNFIPQGAMQYSEEFFQVCLESIWTLPQFYLLHEVTSLTGGTYNPNLTLTFEKQLLTLGSVNITDHRIAPADAQLALDYESISSENPPAQKAKDMHAVISQDANAERLCAAYEPHVCLTRDALVRLLDNHGPEFGEQWELPVVVKVNTGKGCNQQKTVFIDSPLLKTEMTVRERSHICHEESLKMAIMKNGSRKVFHLMTEQLDKDQPMSPKISKRGDKAVDSGLNFEADLVDLETFGETTTTKTTTMKKGKGNEQDGEVSNHNSPSSPVLRGSKRFEMNFNCSSQEKRENASPKTSQPSVTETVGPKSNSLSYDSSRESDQAFTGDSDDDRLAIDESVSPTETPAKKPKASPSESSLDSGTRPPHKGTRSQRKGKGLKASGDQVGEILRMQTAMFKSGNETAATKSPARCAEPPAQPHATSLVKPCVTSYLERHQKEDVEFCPAPGGSTPTASSAAEHKKILSQDLQVCAEDDQDYDAPTDGNLLYKLYSLQDLLVLVRSSIALTHTRNVGSGRNQFVPVHVLPKLEYQLTYGVECLTSSEACQLWTETLLHSTTVSYIAHIDALTSKLALLRKLPDDWQQNTFGFKPPKSLNILHHVLKKLTTLEEGQYLITHKAGEPFVTLLKAAKEKVDRAAYNLQQVHSVVPPPPAQAFPPWIPVDAAVVLPFHQKHGRVPCTFPPIITPTVTKGGGKNAKGGQNNPNTPGSNEGKQNRAAKRNKYIKNLIDQSI